MQDTSRLCFPYINIQGNDTFGVEFTLRRSQLGTMLGLLDLLLIHFSNQFLLQIIYL